MNREDAEYHVGNYVKVVKVVDDKFLMQYRDNPKDYLLYLKKITKGGMAIVEDTDTGEEFKINPSWIEADDEADEARSNYMNNFPLEFWNPCPRRIFPNLISTKIWGLSDEN